MIDSKFILCAESVIRDAETNNISIINILESISAESYPIMIQRSALYTVLTREEGDDESPDLKFVLYNNDDVIKEHKLRVNFRGKNKTRTIIRLGGLPFDNPGEAHFAVFIDDRELGRYSIELNLRDEVEVTSS